MKKVILFSVLAVFFTSVYAQDINKIIIDEKEGDTILVGKINQQGFLANREFSENFKIFYSEYLPDEEIIESLTPLLGDIEITLVLATWCGDSKEQVPAFYRVLTLCGYDDTKINLIAVDHKKKAGDLNIKDLKIKKVPTFIFYRNGEEIGRIIETPETSLEADMLEIVREN